MKRIRIIFLCILTTFLFFNPPVNAETRRIGSTEAAVVSENKQATRDDIVVAYNCLGLIASASKRFILSYQESIGYDEIITDFRLLANDTESVNMAIRHMDKEDDAGIAIRVPKCIKVWSTLREKNLI